MTGATQTAVIVPVAAAEHVVGEHRRTLDRSASWGVPAHVSILYPFADPADVDEAVLARLGAAVASVPVFDCTFARCDWFGEDVLWLAPEPDHGFRALTMAVCRAFPRYPPYGGDFEDVIPHLTIGDRSVAPLEQLRAAEHQVRGALPVPARIAEALLIAGSAMPDSWRTIRRLPLGTP